MGEVSDEEFIKKQLFVALADAVTRDNFDVVVRLLRLGVDPNGYYVNHFSMTMRGYRSARISCLLHMCYENRNFKIFRLLVDAGARILFSDGVKNVCFDVTRRLFYHGDHEHASYIARVYLESPSFVAGIADFTFTDWYSILSPNAPHALNWSLLQIFAHCIPAFKLLRCVKAHNHRRGGGNSLVIQYVFKLAYQIDTDDKIDVPFANMCAIESSFIVDVSIFSRF